MLIRLILLILCAWPTFASAQQEMRSATKGASTPLPITGSVVDADHNALDVKCLSGCSGGGGAVQSAVLASGVTTNTTSATSAGMTGNKTFWAEVVGTGAVTATVAVYGARTSTASNGVLLATLTLSGTTQAQDAAGVSSASYPYYYIVTTNVTGTGATVRAEVFY